MLGFSRQNCIHKQVSLRRSSQASRNEHDQQRGPENNAARALTSTIIRMVIPRVQSRTDAPSLAAGNTHTLVATRVSPALEPFLKRPQPLSIKRLLATYIGLRKKPKSHHGNHEKTVRALRHCH